MESVVLAIDLGGTSLRAGLVTAEGDIVALAARSHRVGDEADAEDWWSELIEAVAELPAADAKGIVLTGLTRSQVLADAAGRPVRPAQGFTDGRATAEAEALALARAADGTWVAMTPYHPLARLKWVERHDPEALARARHLLQPKDWLAFRLTGRAASDRVSNAWALERRGNVRALAPFRRARLDATLLPDLLDPWETLGPAVGLAGYEGVPVFVGAMDTWCASIGAGAGQVGDAYVISGTTDAGGVLAETPVEAEGLVTLPWGTGLFHTGGPSGAGGDCAQWLAGMFDLADGAAVVDLAATADPAARPLLFVPALTGERAPLWQPAARGAFIGLDRNHGRPELARAVLEGVAFAAADLFGDLPIARLVISGGGARADLWCQIRADVLGRPIARAATPEPGVLGAAAVAWAGLGRYPTLVAAQAVMCREDRTFTPDPAAAARLAALRPHFHAARDAAARLGADLAD
jgi:xylulokinase